MLIVREYDFKDLYENSWAGAVDTLDTIKENIKKEELIYLLEDTFTDKIPTDTEVNDFLWFEREYILECLGIDVED